MEIVYNVKEGEIYMGGPCYSACRVNCGAYSGS